MFPGQMAQKCWFTHHDVAARPRLCCTLLLASHDFEDRKTKGTMIVVTSGTISLTTQHNIPEDVNLQQHCSENPKPHNL